MKTIHYSGKPVRTALALLAVAALPVGAVAVPAAAEGLSGSTATACPTGWGSLPETAARAAAPNLTNVRSGRHTCYDRLVVDLAGRPVGYDVRYVTTVRQDGSGAPVALRGGAKLQIVVRAPAYDNAGNPTYRPANPRELADVSGYSTFRQVAYAGSFEGQTTLGLGVRARLPFRVLTLAGPGTGSRLVIDVAHSW